jgi:hypothetical protein
MAKRSQSRLNRDKQRILRPNNVSSINIDRENERIIFTTKDMLVNQIQRDGPIICKSFDRIMKQDIETCSEVFGQVSSMMMEHLPKIDDNGLKATSARLLSSAVNSYIASIEVARHGYPRQFGILARAVIEVLATIISLAIRDGALQEFHDGKLSSTKCIGWAKPVLPMIGEYWGMLSNEFVHVHKNHSIYDLPTSYAKNDERLEFVTNVLLANTWMLYVVSELVFFDELNSPRYWSSNDKGILYNPSNKEREWMASFFKIK